MNFVVTFFLKTEGGTLYANGSAKKAHVIQAGKVLLFRYPPFLYHAHHIQLCLFFLARHHRRRGA
jgi:hypothetical protein